MAAVGPEQFCLAWVRETRRIYVGVDMGNTLGLVVGALAKLITIIIGIAGSIGATLLGQMIGWYKQGESAGFLMSVLGAILILWIYRLFKRRATA
jgi:uncharacterized membrane protein YeaQ/YmgE (transglycosylase-associated protein family)